MEKEDILFNRYELLDEIGRGTAPVYRAFDRRVKRDVAIKRLPGDIESSQETRALAALNHPNIVTLYDAVSDGRSSFLIMELVDGEPLSILLDRGPLQPEAAVAITMEICGALEAAHTSGIVHLDVKPKNVMLTSQGRVKVADFGIASLAGRRGSGFGTPAYAAPEQVSGGIVDERTDIFSVGCLLYEMLVGDSPFASATGKGSTRKVLKFTPPRPSSVVKLPDGLDEIVMTALAKDPGDRFQRSRDLRAALEEFRGDTPLEELLGMGANGQRLPALVRARDFFEKRPLLVQRSTAGVLAASGGYLLFGPQLSAVMAIAGGIAGALLPEAGLAFVIAGAAFRATEFSYGLAIIIAPVLLIYFFVGRLRPNAALIPSGAAALFSFGLSPTFPLIAGQFTAPFAAAAVALAGGVIDSSLYLLSGELAGLKGVANPLVVGSSIYRALERSPAILLQPLLWAVVATGLAAGRKMRITPWLATAIAFIVEAAGYYLFASEYAGIPAASVMRRLAFSLIIIILLALVGPLGHGRAYRDEPD
ncbi:MAG: serine/threonine protein kinase [Chloroflexi bacterium]|nr:serine/threonine protein kinase [Chloroflexota bacterium]